MNQKINTWLGTIIIIILAGTIGAFVYISYLNNPIPEVSKIMMIRKAETQNSQMANPASVYCEKNGGKLEIRTAENEGQVGYCKFSDGTECEEWEFMKGECKNDSSVVDISNWKTYRNEKLGFEIKYPEFSYGNDDYSKIKIIEHENIVWFVLSDDKEYSDKLKKIRSNSTDFEKISGTTWAIVIKSVKNEKELDRIVGSIYLNCKMGEKTESSIKGIYDIKFSEYNMGGDPEIIDDGRCHLFWDYRIKYSPDLKKLAFWDMGQSYTFSEKGNVLDERMIESFNFIN